MTEPRFPRKEPCVVTSVRIPPHTEAAAQLAAACEGKTISEWIREIVDLEIARRDNRCPTCGSELASGVGS
jgi:predicted HicB family RNase H-like nuclease